MPLVLTLFHRKESDGNDGVLGFWGFGVLGLG